MVRIWGGEEGLPTAVYRVVVGKRKAKGGVIADVSRCLDGGWAFLKIGVCCRLEVINERGCGGKMEEGRKNRRGRMWWKDGRGKEE